MFNISSYFDKYIRKTSVQEGIVEQTATFLIADIIKTKDPIVCSYHHHILYVTKVSQESKIAIYLHRPAIISSIQKKLLEHFHLNVIIKDIRIGNR